VTLGGANENKKSYNEQQRAENCSSIYVCYQRISKWVKFGTLFKNSREQLQQGLEEKLKQK
jgi:hypothetical protein